MEEYLGVSQYSPVLDIIIFLGPPQTLKEKNGVILTKKVESLAELKFDQGFRVIG